MSTTMKKGELFVKQVLAKIKGDDSEVLAAKISRKAISAVEGQLAALKAQEVDAENTVEEGQELLNNAMYPTTMITDNQSYIKNIKNAQDALVEAEAKLEDIKTSISYFENILVGF